MQSENKKNKLGLNSRLVVIIIIIIAIIAGLIFMMKQSVNKSVFSERKSLLTRITHNGADTVAKNIEYGENLSYIFADSVETCMDQYESLQDFIAAYKTKPCYSDMIFFLVDSSGKYYSSDGYSGKIVNMSRYTPSSDAGLSYISTLPHLSSSQDFLVFRNRLSSAVEVIADGNKITVTYCGILYDLNQLNATLSEDFSGYNNTFIYDSTNGNMLYKNFGIRMLINGYNIYAKLQCCNLLFGEDPEESEALCRNDEDLCVAFIVDGKEYYFCSSPTGKNNWSVAFVVESDYLESISGSSFGTIILFVTIIAAVIAVAVVNLVISMYKNRVTAESYSLLQSLNKKLEEANDAKSRFLSNMSHDIRTPINGIMGMTTIAMNVEGNPKKTNECLTKISSASHHLLSLINDVLDMSRIEQGRTEIAAKPINIGRIADNCCSIIRGQMTGRQLQLITETDCTHFELIGDDLHLRQIFINILGNAVKFTKDGGTIWFRITELSATEDETLIAFEIEDTGIGMNPEYLNKIFDAFTQDEGGARSEYKGTGLGMSITKSFTELMGGTVAVESQLGKGSKFTVTIPFVINKEAVSEQKNENSEDMDINGIKILLAEDNELNMEIAVELLEDAGAKVTTAENGQEALDTFRNNPPKTFDLILMDIMMPVMNGLDATKAIRALERDDAMSIPIVAMTANAFESDIQATRAAGMNAHLSKPINVNEMFSTIAYHCKKAQEV